MNAKKVFVGLVTTLAMSGCTNYDGTQYMFDAVHNDFEPMRSELTQYDKVVAQADCQVAGHNYVSPEVIGNFGGRDTMAVYLRCMKSRGWLYSGDFEPYTEMVK